MRELTKKQADVQRWLLLQLVGMLLVGGLITDIIVWVAPKAPLWQLLLLPLLVCVGHVVGCVWRLVKLHRTGQF